MQQLLPGRERRQQLMRQGIGVLARNGIVKQDLQKLVILQILRVFQPLQHALPVPFVHISASYFLL